MTMRWMSLLLVFLVSTPIQEVLSLPGRSYDAEEEDYDDETGTKSIPTTDLDIFWSRLIKVVTLLENNFLWFKKSEGNLKLYN